MPIPRILEQSNTHQALRSGTQKIVDAVRPTLGPLSRHLVYENGNKFEVLDDGGVIARRIIQLANRNEDVGAMLLRQVLWQVNQQVGDGTATTAVLFESIYTDGLRFVTAGADPMRLRHYLMQGLQQLSDKLLEQTRFVSGREQLKQVALSVSYDTDMADTLGEVLDTVGQLGQINIRLGHGRRIEHVYVEGSYWKGGVLSKKLTEGIPRMLAQMEDAAVIVSDMDVKEPGDLVPLMQLAIRSEIKNLLLVVGNMSDKGVAVILDKRIREKINVVAVKFDGFQADNLTQARQDLAILTGARPVIKAAGQSLKHASNDDFGSARWVWADSEHFGFTAGKGDPRKLRDHVKALRAAYVNAVDKDKKANLLERLGKLQGGSATVRVGGTTDDDIKLRKSLAERTVRALREAIAGGVIPGGGTALLACQQMLIAKAEESQQFEERAAYQMLATATEAPIRSLLTNAGYDASEIFAQLSYYDAGFGFDLLRGAFVNMVDAGIFDVAHVQKEALQRAVSSAATALTIDVIVLHRNPETMVEP